MNLMTMNDIEEFCTTIWTEISAVHNWTFSIIIGRQSLNVKIFPAEGLNGGKNCVENSARRRWHSANGIRFAFYLFISSSGWETGNFWHFTFAEELFTAASDAFERIRLWEENLEEIQMRFREDFAGSWKQNWKQNWNLARKIAKTLRNFSWIF